MADSPFDLVVVGAGVLGTFHAYHALQRGLRVLLVEKDHLPSGATVRNFGQIVPSGMAPGRWKHYGVESTRLYTALQRQFQATVRRSGTVYLASDEEEWTLLEELHAQNETEGYPAVLLSKQQCLDRYPGLKASYVRGGLFFPDEITVEPRTMIGRVIGYLREQHGLDYRSGVAVVGCEAGPNAVQVRLADESVYEAGHVVVCSGSEFKTLYPALFYASDIEVSKLQMLQTVPQPGGYTLPGSVLTGLTIRRYESFRACPSYDRLEAAHLDPRLKQWGIHILFKQAVDGTVIVGDSHEYRDAREADLLGFDVRADINALMLEEARKIFDLPVWDVQQAWYGLYAQCKTSDLFQKTLDGRIHLLTAVGGKGMTAGPALAGAHIAALFDG